MTNVEILCRATPSAARSARTALSVVCPVCRMDAGVWCEDHNGIQVSLHRPRIESATPGLAVARLSRELTAAQKASDKATAARAALPAGSSRARVTSANARWMRAAEARDRIAAALEAARARGGLTDGLRSPMGPIEGIPAGLAEAIRREKEAR